MSELRDKTPPPKSNEPPITPQLIEKSDPHVTLSEAQLHQKFFGKLKGIFVHLLYLGKYDVYISWMFCHLGSDSVTLTWCCRK